MSKNEDKIKDVEPINNILDTTDEAIPYVTEFDSSQIFLSSQIAILESRNKKLELENKRYELDTNLRDLFAKGYSVILVLWLIAVLYILTNNNANHYHFSDSVLIALLATSTANVIGMVVIVLKNLFPTLKE